MARTLFPHHRHINFDGPTYRALNQAAAWRRCSLAAFVRDAVEVAARADYLARGVTFPIDHEEALPGQIPLWAPPVQQPPAGAPIVPIEAAPTPPSQHMMSPEGADAVRSFLAGGRTAAFIPGDVAASYGPTGEPVDE